MGRRPPFDLTPPPGARAPRALWVALAASVALHALLLTLRIVGRPPDTPHAPNRLIVLRPMETPAVVRAMPFFRPTTPPERRPGLPQPPPPRIAEPEPELPTPVATVPVQPASPDSTPVPPAEVGPLALRPGMGQGKLWVRPMPLPPGELASRLRRKDHIALVDSAVTAIVQQYLDSIAKEPAFAGAQMPEWVTKVGGKEFGLTDRSIVIAGLRIPAAILGFLPLSNKVDPRRSIAARELKDMREDLLRAAQRARNYDDYRQAIRDIRARKQEEHDFEENQRTPPPPIPQTQESP